MTNIIPGVALDCVADDCFDYKIEKKINKINESDQKNEIYHCRNT